MLRRLPLLIPLALVTGCATAQSQSAICDATEQDRTELAVSLADDGGDKSVVAGARLIAKIDSACGE